jgi:amidohydrolase
MHTNKIDVFPAPAAEQAEIRRRIDAELSALIAIRRDLHANPELSMQERRTSRVVQEELARLGIPFKAGLGGGTGVVAHLAATEATTKPAVALRADMDALPITEQTGKPYASSTPGVMHACGHDGHTAMLLGAARILSKLPHRPRPVTFVFQPAEEYGGGGGIMCQEGVLEGGQIGSTLADGRPGGLGPRVGEIFGLHGWPQLPLGSIATRPGPLMAAVDDFVVMIRGTQCHGAYPHLGNDPILATAQIVTALQSIASRNIGPLDSVVVTVGQINAGTANNIIPETCTIVGTVRTLKDSTKVAAKRRFFEIVEGVASSMGCKAEIDWQDGYPVTNNDPGATSKFFSIARRVLGDARVIHAEHPTMGGEDFSFFGQHVPACFFFLGLNPSINGLSKASGGTAEGTFPSLHQPTFDFNDDAIATGVELLCAAALEG